MAHYQAIFERVTAMTRRRPETPINIAAICRAAGVSPRALRRIFHTIEGFPPYQYLCALRLALARRALMSARGGGETVTEVAMRFGFHALGRFSALYRKEFGERPSATLHRAAAETGGSRSSAPQQGRAQ